MKPIDAGMLALVPSLVMGALMGACENAPTADDVAAQKTEVSMQQAAAAVGMPAIKNFNELRLARTIYEMRDDAKLQTWSYLLDMQGKKHLLCKSLGYGLPYATQYSNPQRVQHPYSGVYYTLPQAEPNGLFMPDNAEASWIVCVSPTGEAKPVYVEERMIVSPFPFEEEAEPMVVRSTEKPTSK